MVGLQPTDSHQPIANKAERDRPAEDRADHIRFRRFEDRPQHGRQKDHEQAGHDAPLIAPRHRVVGPAFARAPQHAPDEKRTTEAHQQKHQRQLPILHGQRAGYQHTEAVIFHVQRFAQPRFAVGSTGDIAIENVNDAGAHVEQGRQPVHQPAGPGQEKKTSQPGVGEAAGDGQQVGRAEVWVELLAVRRMILVKHAAQIPELTGDDKRRYHEPTAHVEIRILGRETQKQRAEQQRHATD